MPDQKDPWLHISSGELSAKIDPLGAQLSSLKDRSGRDLLWDGDAAVWAGRAPLLFPIVGALAGGNYRLDSKLFPLPRHGFARGRVFDILNANAATVGFHLIADETSFKVYPFQFELQVDFALNGATLTVTARIFNKGESDMPASFGYHPAFQWPLPFGQARSAHFIEFASDEPAPIRRLNSQGLLSAEYFPTPILDRRLSLNDSLFQDDVIICDEIRSRSLTYGANGGPRIQIGFPDASYLGVWTKPGANFICIEPWHGIADPEGFAGDFRTKPGIVMVASGAALQTIMTITLLG
jgi:galactose mutarotase-like enzyme